MQKSGLASILFAFLLAGCSTQVVVQTSVPVPLVENSGIPIALVLSEEFRNYTYTEEKEGRLNLAVDLGTANTQMVTTIFSALGNLRVIDTANEPIDENTIKVEPTFKALQYSIPAENNVGIYEVWLQYRFLLTDSSGSVIADWQMNGYGKLAEGMLQRHETPIQEAMDIAVRDVGAQLAIGFTNQPQIRDWKSSRSAQSGGGN